MHGAASTATTPADAVTVLNGAKVPHTQCLPVPLFTKKDVGSDIANVESIPE